MIYVSTIFFDKFKRAKNISLHLYIYVHRSCIRDVLQEFLCTYLHINN